MPEAVAVASGQRADLARLCDVQEVAVMSEIGSRPVRARTRTEIVQAGRELPGKEACHPIAAMCTLRMTRKTLRPKPRRRKPSRPMKAGRKALVTRTKTEWSSMVHLRRKRPTSLKRSQVLKGANHPLNLSREMQALTKANRPPNRHSLKHALHLLTGL